MNKFSKAVLDRIEQEDIRPRSKWYFVLKNFFMGLGALAFILLGVIACAMIFQFLEHALLLELVWRSPRIFAKLLWLGFPMVWVILWVILMILGALLTRETKDGYKTCWGCWIFLIFSVQVFGGYALEQSRVGEGIDAYLSRKIEMYETGSRRGDRIWRRPKNGFLGGHIQHMKNDTIIILDPMGKSWNVDIGQAELPEGFRIQKGFLLRIMGEQTGEGKFKAKIIRPRRRGEWRRVR